MGSIAPLIFRPRAVIIRFSEEEPERHYQDVRRRASMLSCIYTDYSPEDNEEALLGPVDLQGEDGEINFDARVATARGAALLGQAAYILLCDQRSELLQELRTSHPTHGMMYGLYDWV